MSRALETVGRLPAPLRRALKRLPGSRRVQAGLAGKPEGLAIGHGELRPVVYLPTWARWDEMRQRPQYLLAAFASAGHDVYFVDPREPEDRIADGVRIVPSIKSAPASDVILYVHFAPMSAMFGSFGDPVVVYDILDDLSIYDADEIGMPEERRVRSHHPGIMKSADVVLASAPALVAKHSVERPDIVLVENGVEPARFRANLDLPEEFGDMPRPVVGYHGAVARWFDFDLLRNVAQRLPQFSFFVVGPVDPDAEAFIAELDVLSNFRRIGAVPSDDIPSYVAGFDVGIVPFVVDDLTRAVSPLKMYEYMAARVPVVATPLPVCVEHEAVRTASTVDDFADAIVAAAGDRHSEALAELSDKAAEQASWRSRVEIVRRRLEANHQLKVQ